MFSKLITMTIVLAGLFGGLLIMRSQRLHEAHRNAEFHQQVSALRQELWRAEVEASQAVRLPHLRRQIRSASIALQPVGTAERESDRQLAYAGATDRTAP